MPRPSVRCARREFALNAHFRSSSATDIFCPTWQSSVVEFNAVAFEPGDRARRFVESRFAENGVVAAAVEQDSQDAMRHDLDLAAGLDELAGQLLGLGLLEAFEPASEPPVATVGDHSQGDVQVDVQANLTRQVIHVKEIHVRSKSVFDAVAAGGGE